MLIQKRWGFSLGTIFSIIVVYFIFLYSKDQGWETLIFISKWYLIVVGGLIGFSLVVISAILLSSFLVFVFGFLKTKSWSKKHKKQKDNDVVDVEYKVKE